MQGHVQTRDSSQARSHAQKLLKMLGQRQMSALDYLHELLTAGNMEHVESREKNSMLGQFMRSTTLQQRQAVVVRHLRANYSSTAKKAERF